jgi:hypothetical protein
MNETWFMLLCLLFAVLTLIWLWYIVIVSKTFRFADVLLFKKILFIQTFF